MPSQDPRSDRDADLVAALGAQPFVDVVTFRRDGTAVHTPVWVAADEGSLLVSTFGDSGKVARLRRDTRAAVAPCAGDGTVAPGTAYHPFRAEVLDRASYRPGVAAFRRKYGRHFAVMWPARWAFRVLGHPRVWLLLRPDRGRAAPVVVAPPPSAR